MSVEKGSYPIGKLRKDGTICWVNIIHTLGRRPISIFDGYIAGKKLPEKPEDGGLYEEIDETGNRKDL